MNNTARLVIPSYKGSYLNTIIFFVIAPINIFLWDMVSDCLIDNLSIMRSELFDFNYLPLIVILFLASFIYHDLCQYLFHLLLGGKPRYRGRRLDPDRSRSQRKYAFPIAMRSWSPNKEFSLLQYMVIVFAPTVTTFLFLLAVVLLFPTSDVMSIVFLSGLAFSLLFSFDFILAVRLIYSFRPGQFLIDKKDGTFFVERG